MLSVLGVPVLIEPEFILLLLLIFLMIFHIITTQKMIQPVGLTILIAGISTILIIITMIMHELAHAGVAYYFGYKIEFAVLTLIGFAVVSTNEILQAHPAVLIAFLSSGLIVQLLVALVCFKQIGRFNQRFYFIPKIVGITNLMLGVGNLLPLPGATGFADTDGAKILLVILSLFTGNHQFHSVFITLTSLCTMLAMIYFLLRPPAWVKLKLRG